MGRLTTYNVDPTELRDMAARGMSQTDIAKVWGCSHTTVVRYGKQFEIHFTEARKRRKVVPVVKETRVISTHAGMSPLEAAVAATGRTYAGRAEISQRFSASLTRVEQIWHRLRAA